jgi:23S rRNA (uridine2552-2'-O)-methyltransferase
LKKNKISKNWINKQRRDIYVRKSKVDGYRSRAVYKLIEIDKKFNILKNGISLVDLGAAPGSWSQYASQHINNCKIASIDIKDMENIDKVHQIKGDFTQKNYQQLIKNYFKLKIDVVLSDMAENTTGNKNVDSISISELCKEAMYFAKEILNEKGVFVSKIFMGSTFNEIILESKSIFKETKIFKPISSRKDSKESFIICKLLK